MSVRSLAALTVAAMTLAALSACHDGAGKRTETTQIRITGTPKAGNVGPARPDVVVPDRAASDAASAPAPTSLSGSPAETGVGPEPTKP